MIHDKVLCMVTDIRIVGVKIHFIERRMGLACIKIEAEKNKLN